MDLILFNGKIITMDPLHPFVQAVGVKDGKVFKVGENDEVLSLKDNKTLVVDLNGKLLVPGFNDSHMHLLSFGASLQKADLTGSRSINDIVEKTKEFISKNGIEPGQWVQGTGWNHDYFDEKRFPTRYDLDKISIEHPICLARACTHICIVNSKALEIIGVDKNTPQLEGGYFDIDESKEPTGAFREKALSLVYDKIPEPSAEDIKSMIIKAANLALEQGLTSIQSDDFEAVPGKDYKKVIQAYKELQESGSLPLRIYQQCLLPNIEKLDSFIDSGYMTGMGNEFYKIGPLKLLADGSLGARTACLCEPYSDDPSTKGIPVYSQEEMDTLVLRGHNSGMQLAIHCIGDRTSYMAFESIEKAQKLNPRTDARHSIVHCQITDEVLLDKYAKFDIVALIQPIFLNYDIHMAEKRIGRERLSTSYSFKGMLNRGVHVALGSDCPVEPFDVMPGIYCAVTRKDLNGYPEGGWMPEQKLTVHEALYAYTLGAAYASFEEDIKGSIIPGKLADMALLSEDIYSIQPERIKDVEILMTIVNGKIAYSKK